MTVIVDTGPLVSAVNRSDRAHGLAAALVSDLGRDLVAPEPVVVEVDHLLHARSGAFVARAFLEAVRTGELTVHFTSPGLMRRAIAFDRRFADLELGYVDGIVMALAERDRIPILTFDFEHFRATRPEKGFWQLVVDERRYAEATR